MFNRQSLGAYYINSGLFLYLYWKEHYWKEPMICPLPGGRMITTREEHVLIYLIV